MHNLVVDLGVFFEPSITVFGDVSMTNGGFCAIFGIPAAEDVAIIFDEGCHEALLSRSMVGSINDTGAPRAFIGGIGIASRCIPNHDAFVHWISWVDGSKLFLDGMSEDKQGEVGHEVKVYMQKEVESNEPQ